MPLLVCFVNPGAGKAGATEGTKKTRRTRRLELKISLRQGQYGNRLGRDVCKYLTLHHSALNISRVLSVSFLGVLRDPWGHGGHKEDTTGTKVRTKNIVAPRAIRKPVCK